MSLAWIAAHRGALAVIPLAAIAGLTAGFVLAPDGTRATHPTRTITETHTTTLVVSRTVTEPGDAVTRTITKSAPSGAHAADHPPAAPVTRGSVANSNHPERVATHQHFAGNGARYLGDLTVASAETMRWSSTGPRFQLLFGTGNQAVDSTSHSGQIFVPAGTYYQVRVQTDGHWTVKIG